MLWSSMRSWLVYFISLKTGDPKNHGSWNNPEKWMGRVPTLFQPNTRFKPALETFSKVCFNLASLSCGFRVLSRCTYYRSRVSYRGTGLSNQPFGWAGGPPKRSWGSVCLDSVCFGGSREIAFERRWTWMSRVSRKWVKIMLRKLRFAYLFGGW